jgi:hypothetical protein
MAHIVLVVSVFDYERYEAKNRTGACSRYYLCDTRFRHFFYLVFFFFFNHRHDRRQKIYARTVFYGDRLFATSAPVSNGCARPSVRERRGDYAVETLKSNDFRRFPTTRRRRRAVRTR